MSGVAELIIASAIWSLTVSFANKTDVFRVLTNIMAEQHSTEPLGQELERFFRSLKWQSGIISAIALASAINVTFGAFGAESDIVPLPLRVVLWTAGSIAAIVVSRSGRRLIPLAAGDGTQRVVSR